MTHVAPTASATTSTSAMAIVKVFFFISIVSLAIGLACTNLLFTYYVHDYNIESGNRDKNRIFCLRQDNPMQDGSKVAYADANIPPMLKEKYAEVED